MNVNENEYKKRFFILCLIFVILVFAVIFFSKMKYENTIKNYEQQINVLKELVTKAELSSEVDTNTNNSLSIYEYATEFITYMYSVNSNTSAKYREEKLQMLMTEQAYEEYNAAEYNNQLGYTIDIDNIEIYANHQEKDAANIDVVIFYTEYIKWPKIDYLEVEKYWKGTFQYSSEDKSWRLKSIDTNTELISREELNYYNEEQGEW